MIFSYKTYIFVGIFLLAFALNVHANPQGEQVIAGSAVFDRTVSGTLKVTTASDKTIINYDSFSIAANETTRFDQPGVSSAILNRVVGIDPSSIMGTLSSNGKIFLVNPNGILFGTGSKLDAPAVIASTLDINNDDFLSGRYVFLQNGKGGSILNQGRIAAQPGGYIALLSRSVDNRGVVIADLGTVALASGEKITLSLDSNNFMAVTIDEAVQKEVLGLDNSIVKSAVDNSGTIQADGGRVILTSKALNRVFDQAVNNTGVVRAVTVADHGGVVEFLAPDGNIKTSGVLESSALIERGNTFSVGGTFHPGRADVQNADDAIEYTSDTNVSGTITDPGDIIVDPAVTLTMDGPTAFNAGESFLMAPTSTINGNGFDLSISAWLDSELGNINNVGLLTLSSGSDADVTFTSNSSSTFQVTTVKTDYHAILSRSVGTGTDVDPFIIYSISNAPGGLQYILTSGLELYYQIANRIDAAETVYWNSGTGFTPLGDFMNPFTGSLEGFLNYISNLYINLPTTSYVGLFGFTADSEIKNVILVNSSITGYQYTGGLAGWNNGVITNCNNTGEGNVTGTGVYLGGLVGFNAGSITDGYNRANVSGSASSYVGGLAGYQGGSITNSYNEGSVSGLSYVGGVAGSNGGTIADSLNVGDVSGSNGFGGLVGSHSGYVGSITNSYYNIDDVLINGQHLVTIGGLYNAQYQDWVTHSYSLNIDNYFSKDTNGYYLINNTYDLQNLLGFSEDAAGYRFLLVNDIDMSANPGLYIPSFSQEEFNGNGRTISNLNLDLNNDAMGLFGFADTYSLITNVRLENVNISGTTYIGGLVGLNLGSVYNSSSSGLVSGQGFTGGLVGWNYGGWIINSYSTGSVEGYSTVGGLAGGNMGGQIRDSYSSNNVIGYTLVGGLTGFNDQDGNILNVFSTGNVSGTAGDIGGLVGSNQGTIGYSFSTGSVTGADNTGGFLGLDDGGTINYSGWWTGAAAQAIGSGGSITYNEADPSAFYDPGHALYNENDPPWDFDSIWDSFGTTYPHLQWENYSPSTNGINISGTAFSEIGGFPLENGYTIILVVDGNQNGSTLTDLSGMYYFYDIIADSGSAVLVYLSASGLQGNAITMSGGLDIVNLNIYGNALTLKHESVAPVSNSILAAAKGALTDTDILFSGEGLDLAAHTSIYIAPGMTYAPGGNIEIAGSWVNEGIFDAGTYNVTFNGSGPITSGGSPFYDVLFDNASGTWGLNDHLAVDGDLNIAAGTVISETEGVAVAQDFIQTGGVFLSTPTTSFSVGGNFSLTGNLIFNRYTGNGSGTTPYVIYDVYGLQGMSQLLGSSFILNNDIDASMTGHWNSGTGFVPVGDYTNPFSGSLDGMDYTISDLVINSPDLFYTGLFGATSYTSFLSNIRLADVNITGGVYVGGLVGWNEGYMTRTSSSGSVNANGVGEVGGLVGWNAGPIDTSYTSGTVSGSSDVGGLVGWNASSIAYSYSNAAVSGGSHVGGLAGGVDAESTVDNSYSTGSVSGGSGVGGLVGANYGFIERSYSTSSVLSVGSDIGGLVGWNNALVENSYSTGEVSGSGTDVGGLVGWNGDYIGNSYSTSSVTGGTNVGGLAGYNFNTIDNSFSIGSVNGSDQVGGLVGYNDGGINNSGWWTGSAAQAVGNGGEVTYSESSPFAFMDPGHGIYVNPEPIWDIANSPEHDWIMAGYPHLQTEWSASITDVQKLQMMWLDLTAAYNLANDIDAAETANWNNGAGFVPVGSDITPFSGSLNGNTYGISDLTINTATDYTGLLGYTSGSTLSDILLANVNINGATNTGGLVGRNDGVISNSVVNGNVEGSGFVGILAGYNALNGSITGSNSAGNVTGSADGIGGLVGSNVGTISDSFSTATVTSGEEGGYIGGLVGSNNGTISRSYSLGIVDSAVNYAGGLVGLNWYIVTDSYSTASVNSSGSYAGGLVGGLFGGSVSNSYSTSIVNGDIYVGGLLGYIDPYGSVLYSYSTGSAIGNDFVGGLAGANNGSITDCGWWTGAAAMAIGNEGEVTYNESDPAAFYDPAHSIYAEWDFVNTWDSFPAEYPKLKWQDFIPQLNISGTAFDGMGGNPLGSSRIIILVINGIEDRGAETNPEGFYSFSNVTADVGYIILVYISGDAIKGNTITMANGLDIAGLDIYGSTITLRHETADPVSNSTLAAAKGDLTDTDILYTVTGSDLAANASIHIAPGMTFAPGGNIELSGSWVNSGTFDPGNALVRFNGSGDIISGGSHFYDMSLENSSGSWSPNDTLTVDNDFTMTGGTMTVDAGGVAIGGDFLQSGGLFISDPATSFSVGGSFAVTGSGIFRRFAGSGTSNDPYLVADVYGLQSVKYYLSSYFRLSSSIDASSTEGWNNGAGFVPLGNGLSPFTGSFEGDDLQITNLTINTDSDYAGLFGYIYSGAQVSNLRLINVNVGGGNGVGGLAGVNSGSISNSSSSGRVSGASYVGSLAGYNYSSGTITASSGSGLASGSGDGVGGLAGGNAGSISGSYADGEVSGSWYVGGLAGYNYAGGSISNSHCYSGVSGSGDGVGGLTGGNGGSISSSYSTGSVAGGSYVGGLTGYNYSTGSISNSYTNDTVTGTGDGVGGLTGANGGSVLNTYSTGDVSGSNFVGGLGGYNYPGGLVKNSYSSGCVTASGDAVGGFTGANGGEITNSYAAGTVTGRNYVGGLAGYNYGPANNAYFTDNTYGTQGGGIYEAGGMTAFCPATGRVYHLGQTDQWDLTSPVWDFYAAELPHLHFEHYNSNAVLPPPSPPTGGGSLPDSGPEPVVTEELDNQLETAVVIKPLPPEIDHFGGMQFNFFHPMGGVYFYHPLALIDYSAFGDFNLDAGAYEFIDKKWEIIGSGMPTTVPR